MTAEDCNAMNMMCEASRLWTPSFRDFSRRLGTATAPVAYHSFINDTRDFPEGQVRTILISSLYPVAYAEAPRGRETADRPIAVHARSMMSWQSPQKCILGQPFNNTFGVVPQLVLCHNT